jgi:oxaloacetate decarboxylase (Na+ extruding) subunit alpha
VKKIEFVDTTLRDGQQSLLATRLRISHMEPVLEALDSANLRAMEVWGGATFDSCLRYLDEDPWERLRIIRKRVVRTKLQMLMRGQNVMGYKHYPDDVVREFVKRAVGNGIDIVRVFDALNDARNLETAIDQVKREKAHVQGAISYTVSPCHTMDRFVSYAVELKELGVDSIAVKDMSGLLTPFVSYSLIRRLKEAVDLPVELHTHCTGGFAEMTYLKGIEAGADIIDTAVSSLAGGSSQPCLESMVRSLEGSEFTSDVDLGRISEVSVHLNRVKDDFVRKGICDYRVLGIDPSIVSAQIPGGMISNLLAQLKEISMEDRLGDVMSEIGEVRRELGYPPLVTPTSQIVSTQALMNVVSGKRYEYVSNEVRDYVRGMYGRPPGDIDESVYRSVLGDERAAVGRPADLLEPRLDDARREMAFYSSRIEDVLSYALFGSTAVNFFKMRNARDKMYDGDIAGFDDKSYPV